MWTAKRLVRRAAKVAFAAADPFAGRMAGPRILTYHQVGSSLGREMEVSIETFRRQIDWLADHRRVVNLETAIRRRAQPDAAELVVLTFDDGYDDMYRNAYPLMRERRLPFTVYLTTHPTETGEPLAPGATAVSWDQLREMRDSGLMTLGAHTHTHPDLRQVDAVTVEAELERCDELIAERTGVVPQHFTYPWGYWSKTADGPVRRRYGTATVGGGPSAAGDDLHVLNRVAVQWSDGVALFKLKMRGGLLLEDKVRRRVRGYHGP